MIHIFQLYQDFSGRANVHQGGHVTPTIFTQWLHEIQMDLYNKRIDDFQKTQKIADEITPFLDSINAIVNSISGQAHDLVKKPIGYENYASARILKLNNQSCGIKSLKEFDGQPTTNLCKKYIDEDEIESLRFEAEKNMCEMPITLVDNDRWSGICNDRIVKLSCKNPKMSQYSGGFRLAPKGCATNIIMDFFRLPKKPIFNFTIDNPQSENEYYTFVEAGSVHLEWSEQLLPMFIAKLLDKYAIFVGDDALWQQSKVEQKK